MRGTMVSREPRAAPWFHYVVSSKSKKRSPPNLSRARAPLSTCLDPITITPVDERSLTEERACIARHQLQFADFAVNRASPDRPRPYVSPCRRYKAQALYWMNEDETNRYIVDRIDLARATLSKPKKYNVPSNAHRMILAALA